MGIPYYFYTLTKLYPNILLSTLPKNIDIFSIDFNGSIHPVAQSVNIEQDGDINKIFDALWTKTEDLIKVVSPKKVCICADGIAPLAKIVQQRKRRYMSSLQKQLDGKTNKWNTNAITPGTSFMKSLDKYMYNKCGKYIYSGSDINGEGEHKIFNYLSNETNKNIVIHGMDADLILISLINKSSNNIYLMREQNDDKTVILDINELYRVIISEMIEKFGIHQEDDLIDSYCVLCSLLGNDFIPHLMTVGLKNDGHTRLMRHFQEGYKAYGLLVQDGKINKDLLSFFFQELSKDETDLLMKETRKYILSKPIYENKIDEFAKSLINNDDCLVSNWKKKYYKYMFDINETNEIKTVAHKYLDGVYWTYNYYKYKKIDHTWYYPYNTCPTIIDIYNNINKHNYLANEQGNFLSNNVQLLIVTPKASIYILDSELQTFMVDDKKGLTYMYPIEYQIIRFLKKHLWECIPILPIIDVEHVNSCLQEYL